jgi:hypothetical protein
MISTLTQNDTFMLIFWSLLASPIGLWHLWYFRGKKGLSENELAKISRKFRGINSSYTLFTFLLMPLILVPALLLSRVSVFWIPIISGVRFFPLAFMIFAGCAIYQGLFALSKGVYPTVKSLSYVYDETPRIRFVAKYQILIGVAVDLLIGVWVWIMAS